MSPFRELGAGGPYPAWVRALLGRSGVYVVRVATWFGFGAPAIVYVGESHTGRLYQTLTRHFQSWSGPTSGPTYSRGDVEVSVAVTPASKAVEAQDRLIRKHAPRDNVRGRVDLEEVPF